MSTVFRDDPRRLSDKRFVAASEERKPRKKRLLKFSEIFKLKKFYVFLEFKLTVDAAISSDKSTPFK